MLGRFFKLSNVMFVGVVNMLFGGCDIKVS